MDIKSHSKLDGDDVSETKFRAWDKEHHTMLDKCPNMLIDFEGRLYWQFGYREPEMLDADDYILMKYTGIIDTNKAEIYESDIIPTKWGNMVVTWECCGFILKSNGTHWIDWYSEQWLEVIGNIHENPELMKKH